MKIYDLRAAWNYDTMANARDHTEPTWFECSQATSDYFLGALPPIYFAGGFACSEPYDSDELGRDRYACFVSWGGRTFARIMSTAQAVAEAVRLTEFLEDMSFVSPSDQLLERADKEERSHQFSRKQWGMDP